MLVFVPCNSFAAETDAPVESTAGDSFAPAGANEAVEDGTPAQVQPTGNATATPEENDTDASAENDADAPTEQPQAEDRASSTPAVLTEEGKTGDVATVRKDRTDDTVPQTGDESLSGALQPTNEEEIAVMPMAAGPYTVTSGGGIGTGTLVGEFPSLGEAAAACTDSALQYTITLTADDPAHGAAATILPGISVTLTSSSATPGTITTSADGYRHMELSENSTLILKNITLNGNGNTFDGAQNGGISVGNGAALTVGAGALIQNCYANDGGGVSVDGGTATISGGTITRNKVKFNGAGVYVKGGGAVIVDSGDITANDAQGNGGGVHLEASSKLTMSGGTIADNTANGNGGGIHLAGGSTAKITGGTISGNHGNNGGGIFADGNTLPLSGVDITGNIAAGDGGGVRGTGGITITITDSDISGNTAGYGAGLSVNSGSTLVMNSGSVVNNNICSNRGGGLNLDSSTLTMNDGEISGNTADVGGGVLTDKSTMYMYGGSITGNTASGNGGGIYAEGNSPLTIDTNGAGVPANIRIADNKAGAGAGIYAQNVTSITGAEITGNTAIGSGGGVFAEGASLALADVSITRNGSGDNGGGIRGTSDTSSTNGITMTITGSDISGNTAPYGAGMSVNNAGDITMSGTAITGNVSSNRGGGVNIDNGTTLTMEDGKISGNTAVYGGGLIASLNSNFIMKSGEVTGNNADQYGGGLRIESSCIATLNGTGGSIRIEGNTSENGGGIHNQGTIEITNVSIANNEASVNGGGINAEGGTTITDAVITNNSAASDGGGLFITKKGSVSLNNTNVTSNTSNKDGGGIRVSGDGSGLTLNTGTTVSGNSATYGGGVSANESSTVTMESGSAVTGNVCTRRGGGVNIDKNTIFTMNGGTISGNNAVTGGGVIVSAGSTFNLGGGAITGNHATGTGGGIRLEDSALVMSGGSIDSNEANSSGGGVYLTTAASLNMTAGSITANKAVSGDGGGIYTEDLLYADPLISNYTNISMSGSAAVSGNTASVKNEPPTVVNTPLAFDEGLLTNYQINYYETQTSLVYDANIANHGAAGTGGDNIVKQYGIGNVTLPMPSDLEFSPAAANYAFKEWNTQADGGGIGYAAGSVVTVTGPGDTGSSTGDTIRGGTTLYAIWRTPAILLSGYVFSDTNPHNNQYDAGEGLKGITVTLYEWDGNDFVYSAVNDTNADGVYEFGLTPGKTYKISVPLLATTSGGVPVGEAGFIVKGSDDNAVQSHVYQATGKSDEIVVGPETDLWTSITRNAGYAPDFPVPTGIHSDQKPWALLILVSSGMIALLLFYAAGSRGRKRS